jgi:hypothetical protein
MRPFVPWRLALAALAPLPVALGLGVTVAPAAPLAQCSRRSKQVAPVALDIAVTSARLWPALQGGDRKRKPTAAICLVCRSDTCRGVPGRLDVTITAGTNTSTLTDRIVEIWFGEPRASTNALVDFSVGQQGVVNGQRWTPYVDTSSVLVYVRPETEGTAATVNLTVVDLCGECSAREEG